MECPLALSSTEALAKLLRDNSTAQHRNAPAESTTLELRLSIQFSASSASASFELLSHICPPAFALSSPTPTRAPHSAALTAAAMPAGPPPITSTSKRSCESLLIGFHVHPWFTDNLATSAMPSSIDRNAAFETDPHPAQRPTSFAAHRCPARLAGHRHGH